MNSLLHHAAKVGHLLYKNKGKLVIALGTIAAANLVNIVFKRQLHSYLEKEVQEPVPAAEKPAEIANKNTKSARRAVYHAPQIPKQNLMRH